MNPSFLNPGSHLNNIRFYLQVYLILKIVVKIRK